MVYRSDCRYLPFSIHFSEFPPIVFYMREQTKLENYPKSAIFLCCENGAQSINTERASFTKKDKIICVSNVITGTNLLVKLYITLIILHFSHSRTRGPWN